MVPGRVKSMNREKSLKKFECVIDDLKNYYTDHEINSISILIQDTAWYDTVYRTFNEGLRLMWKENRQDSLPGSLIEYIHLTHLRYVLFNIRKLFEPKRRGDERKVVSIPTIINKIESNIGLFTRYYYVRHDGMPYDYVERVNSDNWKVDATVKMRHGIFDLLCQKRADKDRSQDDKLKNEIVDSLKKYAILNADIENLINNYIAHASDTYRKKGEYIEIPNVSLMKIQKQYRIAIWAIHQIGKIIGNSYIPCEVPTPQFDQLKGWEYSIFTESIKKKLLRYWDERVGWWNKWNNTYWDYSKYYITPNKYFELS